MHLIMCTTFSSTANKFEFLNMAYHLIDRLTALVSFIIQRIHSNSNYSLRSETKFVSIWIRLNAKKASPSRIKGGKGSQSDIIETSRPRKAEFKDYNYPPQISPSTLLCYISLNIWIGKHRWSWQSGHLVNYTSPIPGPSHVPPETDAKQRPDHGLPCKVLTLPRPHAWADGQWR